MRAWLFGFGFFFKLGFLRIELIDVQDESVLMMINSRKTSAWI